jgi:NADPH:quinone reductase-like Zn-dependent oxidoreductase
VVFDTVGGEVQVRSYEVLKPGGRLVWIAAAQAGFAPSRQDVHGGFLSVDAEQNLEHSNRIGFGPFCDRNVPSSGIAHRTPD